MNIETKFFGNYDISDRPIITFSKGLPAFEDEQEFVVLPFDEGTPFYVLQSVNTVETAFIMADPFEFFSDYKVKLPEATIEHLQIDKEDDVAIFTLLTVQEPFTNTTTNLQAPIIINAKAKRGEQLILVQDNYETKHYLFPQEQEAKVGEAK
ncbi:MAG TPA: flagellar assembly protein FliW [Bacilli bacterium]|nr:flagellar assembly protein FliW [Bacilli bacterium]